MSNSILQKKKNSGDFDEFTFVSSTTHMDAKFK